PLTGSRWSSCQRPSPVQVPEQALQSLASLYSLFTCVRDSNFINEGMGVIGTMLFEIPNAGQRAFVTRRRSVVEIVKEWEWGGERLLSLQYGEGCELKEVEFH